jgi:fused signal recognition particle receptor
MIAGVNGAGKTTSIGKLAKHFQAQGMSVLLAAGDTFRPPRASSCRPGASATR